MTAFFTKQLDIPGYNASILKTEDGYIGLTRTCISYERYGVYPECGNTLFAFKLDTSFSVLDVQMIKDESGRKTYKNWTEGFEDPRLLTPSSALVVTCDSNNHWHTEVSEIVLDGHIVRSVRPYQVKDISPMNQKNWLFLRHHDDVYDDYLYSSFPFKILRLHRETKCGSIVKTITTPQSYTSHNGSVVKLDSGFLFTSRIKRSHEYLYSLWVRMDDEYNVLGISNPFLFTDTLKRNANGTYPRATYEMCMSLHLEGPDLVVCVSAGDARVFIQKYKLSEILESLH